MWDLLNEWRSLTEIEREAIGTEDWARVSSSQASKQRLQARIHDVWTEASAGSESAGLNMEWQRIIAAEERNLALLNQKMDENKKQRDGLSGRSKKLGQIKTAYAGTPVTFWASYS